MICQRCLRGLSTSRSLQSAPLRSRLAKSTPYLAAHSNASTLPLRTSSSRSASTETAPRREKPSSESTSVIRAARPRSSVPAGQPLKGINFEKNKQDPIAKPDTEYPDWLWTLLDRQAVRKDEGEEDAEDAGLYSKSKKVKRAATRALRKKALLEQEAPKVPIYEQSVDLPCGADGSLAGRKEAFAARAALTRSLRQKRRATIKETNYLKSMR